jgi:hypothetical protein
MINYLERRKWHHGFLPLFRLLLGTYLSIYLGTAADLSLTHHQSKKENG